MFYGQFGLVSSVFKGGSAIPSISLKDQLPSTNAARIAWPDYARGFAIILVVFRHLIEGLNRADLDIGIYKHADTINVYFSGFRLPAFFIVAGVLAAHSLKLKTPGAFVSHRAAVILYPYLLWGSAQLALQLAFPQWVNAKRSITDYSHLLYLPRTIDQFWYLYAVFNISVLFVILLRGLKIPAVFHLIAGVVFYLLDVYLQRLQIETGFLHDILHYYLFFALGVFCSEFLLDPKNAPMLSSDNVLIVTLVFFLLCQGLFSVGAPAKDMAYFEFFTTHNPVLFFIMAISGAGFLIAFSFWLSRKQALVVIQKIGGWSLYIYLWHVFFIAALRIVLVRLLHIENVHLLVWLGMAVGITMPILLFRLSSRHSWQWLYRAPTLFGTKRNPSSIQYAKV